MTKYGLLIFVYIAFAMIVTSTYAKESVRLKIGVGYTRCSSSGCDIPKIEPKGVVLKLDRHRTARWNDYLEENGHSLQTRIYIQKDDPNLKADVVWIYGFYRKKGSSVEHEIWHADIRTRDLSQLDDIRTGNTAKLDFGDYTITPVVRVMAAD